MESPNVPARSGLWVVVVILLAMVSLFGASLAFASTSGTLLPKADGNYSQWTPKTGTTHFTMVNDTACNGTTNFNFTNTVGQRDSYVISTSTVPAGATIAQIDIVPCASRDVSAAGVASVMNVFYRFGGVDSADAGGYSFAPGSGNTPTQQATTTFSGLSLVQTSTTSLEVGAVFTSGTAAKGLRISRVAAVVTYTALAAPSSLSAGSTTASTTKLAWTDNSSNETGFNVERSTDGINFTGIASTSANTVSYSDTGLTASTTYYYRVRAFNAGGYSTYSNTANTTTLDTAPLAPSGLSASVASSTQINLSWADNSSNETAFEVVRSTDGVSFSHVASTSANATGYNDSGLAGNAHYFYKTRAFNAIGYSSFSNTADATTTDVLPAAPSGLTDTATTSSVIGLSWTDNSGNETAFAVERSTDGSTWSQIASTSANATSYYDSGLSANTLYYHRVRAYNALGYSSYSANASATTTDVLPNAPSALSTTATTTSAIGLSWTDNAGNETTFTVERSTNGSTWSQIASTSANATAYYDSGLSANTHYFHRVRAYNAIGYSSYSNTADATTTDTLPAAPTGLAGVATTTSQIGLTWNDNSLNETAFAVERTIDLVHWTQVASTSAHTGTSTSYYDSGLSANTVYYHRVRAYNAIGYSGYSNASVATTTNSVPTAPSGLSASSSPTLKQASLSWADNSSNETSFEVLRSTNNVTYSHLASTSANVTAYVDTTVNAVTSYWYKVRAYDSAGYSASTSAAFVFTGNIPQQAGSVTATASTTALSIAINWTDSSTTELSYALAESTSTATSTFQIISTLPANTTSTTYTPALQNTQYYFEVLAINGYGTSTSAIASTTSATTPSAPSGLTIGTTTSSDINLTWTDNSSNELGFNVEHSTDAFTWTTVATTSANTTVYDDTGLSANTAYYYRVRAFNSVGYSSYSSAAIGTTTNVSIPAPVSYWKLDETSGDAADSAGSNTLTNDNGATYSSGLINNAVNLSATSTQWLSVTDASSTGLDLNDVDFTVSTWVKYASAPTQPGYPLFAKYSCCGDTHTEGYVADIETDATGPLLYFFMRNSSETPTSGIIRWDSGATVGTWYQLVTVYSNSTGTLKFYVNGSLIGSASGFSGIQDTPTDFTIGSKASGGTYTDGTIDEFGVWNSALTDEQIAALYNSGAGRPYSTF